MEKKRFVFGSKTKYKQVKKLDNLTFLVERVPDGAHFMAKMVLDERLFDEAYKRAR